LNNIVKNHYCPECGAEVVYNGNYYCIRNDQGEQCWIMDPNNPHHVIIRAYLNQERRRYIANGDKEGADLMDFYLSRL